MVISGSCQARCSSGPDLYDLAHRTAWIQRQLDKLRATKHLLGGLIESELLAYWNWDF